MAHYALLLPKMPNPVETVREFCQSEGFEEKGLDGLMLSITHINKPQSHQRYELGRLNLPPEEMEAAQGIVLIGYDVSRAYANDVGPRGMERLMDAQNPRLERMVRRMEVALGARRYDLWQEKDI